MKKTLMPVALIMLILLACSCANKEKTFKLKGTVTSYEGKVITISHYNDKTKENDFEDTLKINKGSFEYSRKLENPTLLVIKDAQKKTRINFFAENVDYTVTGDLNDAKTVKFTGGALCNEFNALNDLTNSISDYVAKNNLNKQFNAAQDKNDTIEVARLRKVYKTFADKVEIKKMQLVKDNSKSPVSAFIIYSKYEYGNLAQVKEALAMLDPSLASNEYYVNLVNISKVLERTEIGKLAPVFKAKTPEGKEVSLSDYRGNLLLLDFGASWCFWCKKEIPNMRNVYKKYHDKGFTILSVSFDTKRDAWLNMIKEDKLPWDQASNLNGFKDAAAKEYGITGIPQIYLIGKDGKILAKDLRGEKDMDTAISNALK